MQVCRLPIKRIFSFLLVYFLIASITYWVVKDPWTQSDAESTAVTPHAFAGDLSGGAVLEQTFTPDMDDVHTLYLQTASYGANTDGAVLLEILHAGETLYSSQTPVTELTLGGMHAFHLDNALQNVLGKQLTLRITGLDIPHGDGLTFWYGVSQSAGRFDVALTGEETLTLDGEAIDGMLVMVLNGVNRLAAAAYFWPVAGILGLMLLVFLLVYETARIKKPESLLLRPEMLVRRYSYLLKQLIMRDFKVRYKASMLGVLWSLLNPLLMMTVYYFVFSTLFKSNIEHFSVYLLTGIVLFNYFSESTSLGLNSIVGNASLITKVYVPKFIYPMSKALSSSINMFTSLVPVLLIMLLSGVPITPALLLIPFVLVCIILFSMGMCMFLSTLMTFFRDTQFLWSVLITVWNFLTPIFYPESILSEAIRPLMKLNPLYHFISFLRSLCLYGQAPAPSAFLGCLLAALIPLLIGFIVFKKNQDKFVLHL